MHTHLSKATHHALRLSCALLVAGKRRHRCVDAADCGRTGATEHLCGLAPQLLGSVVHRPHIGDPLLDAQPNPFSLVSSE